MAAAAADSDSDAPAAGLRSRGKQPGVDLTQDAGSWKDGTAAELGIAGKLVFSVRRGVPLAMTWRQVCLNSRTSSD